MKNKPDQKDISLLREQLRRHGEWPLAGVSDADLAEISRRVLVKYGIYDRRTHVAVPVNRQAKLLAFVKLKGRSGKNPATGFCVPNRPDPSVFKQSAICQGFYATGLGVTGCYRNRYKVSDCFKRLLPIL